MKLFFDFSTLLPHIFLFALLLLCFLPTLDHANAADSDFSEGWLFHLGDVQEAMAVNFNDAVWEKVTMPHPARIEARVTDKGSKQQWEGICWYRKTFTLPAQAQGQVVLVRFEGGMNLAQAYVNGEESTRSVDGYLPFV